MAQAVEFGAKLKKVVSTLKVDKEGDVFLMIGVQLEGDGIAAEDVKKLVHMQGRGEIEPRQGELPLKTAVN